MKGIVLPDRMIAHDQPCYIIAEAGVNHNGDLTLAKKMVDVAAKAGADAVKFQTFKTEEIILKKAPKAQYHIETTGRNSVQSWFDLLKSQEMDQKMHEQLIQYCEQQGVQFLSTPYDRTSIDLLDKLNVPMFKVASTDANNLPFLRYLASKGRPIILSTAMSTLIEIVESVEEIRTAGVKELVVLQCTGSYPSKPDQANIRAMKTIAETCDVAVGYSDHVLGNIAAIVAIAQGACVYEKHFTMDRELPGPDHRASLEPIELKELIRVIREAESMLGDGRKRIMLGEVDNRKKLRKFIVAKKKIQPGEIFSDRNLTTKRTGGQGLEPKAWNSILGLKAPRLLDKDKPILPNDVIIGTK